MDDLGLPFLTRNMLDFKDGTVYDLELVVNDSSTDTFNVIGMTKSGVFNSAFVGDGNATDYSVIIGLSDIPIFVTVQETLGYTDRDSTYITGYLRINKTRVLKLFNGQQFKKNPMSWPMTTSYDRQLDIGHFSSVAMSSPAAGADLSAAVGGSKAIRVRAIYFQLVTDSNAATRTVNLQLGRLATAYHFWACASQATQTASLTRKYAFFPQNFAGVTTLGTFIYGALPNDLILRPTDFVITSITNKQVGDQISDIVIIGETIGVE